MKPCRHPVTAFPGSFSLTWTSKVLNRFLNAVASADSESTKGTTSKVRRYTLFKAL